MPLPEGARIPLAPPPSDLSLEAFVYAPPRPPPPCPSPAPPSAASSVPPTAPPPPLGVVLLHPHPRLGGDAANPVVAGLAAALARQAGATAVAVNGRGVGLSGGSSPLVRVTSTAAADAMVAVRWLRGRLGGGSTGGSGGGGDGGLAAVVAAPPTIPPPTVLLLGYSYGAAVALRAAAAVAATDPPLPVVIVSPPVGPGTAWLLGVPPPPRLPCGALFVGGDADVFASASDFRRVAAAAAGGGGDSVAVDGGGGGGGGGEGRGGGGSDGGTRRGGVGGGGVELRLVPRAGHFWESAGAFATLRDAVVGWVIRQHTARGG